jgi:hypothetical protein
MPLSPVQPPSAKHAHPQRPAAPPPEEIGALRPASLGRRLGLLFLLLVLPISAVSVPALLVTHFFGQRPPEGKTATAMAGFEALRASLTKSAQTNLPDSSALLPAPAELTVPAGGATPAEIDARFAGLTHLAQRLGGRAVEKPADAAGRHLFVELPAETFGTRAVFERLTVHHLDLVTSASSDAELDKLIAVAATNPLVTATSQLPSHPPRGDGKGPHDFLTVTVARAPR